MGSIEKVMSLGLPGVKLFEAKVNSDNRGSNIKIFSSEDFKGAGISFAPLEILSIHSNKNALRGLHYQRCHGQSRVISCTKGKLFICIVNMDLVSGYMGKHCTHTLINSNEYIYIPPTCALGTLALEESDFICMCGDNPFMSDYASGVKWDDEDLAVEWPLRRDMIVMSNGDRRLPAYKECFKDKELYEKR